MIVLARADYLDLVPKLVSSPVIPRAVAAEIRAGEADDPAAKFLGQPSWLTVVDLNPALSPLAIPDLIGHPWTWNTDASRWHRAQTPHVHSQTITTFSFPDSPGINDSNAFAHEVTVEIEKTARPALVAQWLCLRPLARVPRRSTTAHATAFRKNDK